MTNRKRRIGRFGDMNQYSNCKLCGRVVAWHATPKRGKVALERVRAWRADPDGVARPGPEVLVDHRVTCREIAPKP